MPPVPQPACSEMRGTPEAGQTYAEVAHEAIFRRWDKLRDWIAAEREFLAWRSGLETTWRAWQEAPDGSKTDALLMGFALAQARSWLAERQWDIPEVQRQFIMLSSNTMRRRTRRVQALVGGLALVVIAVLAGWFAHPSPLGFQRRLQDPVSGWR